MLIRFLAVLFALGLIVSLCLKIFPSVTKSNVLSVDRPKTEMNQKSSLRWLSQKRISATRASFSEIRPDLNLGDVLALNQISGQGQSCVFGVFKVVRLNEQFVILDAIAKKNFSRLQLWADAQGLEHQWTWSSLKLQKPLPAVVQHCHHWIQVPASQAQPALRIVGETFFIRGSQYSEVKPLNTADVEIDVDLMRRGWWIRPQKNRTQVNLIARNATTGLPEEISLHFDRRVRSKVRPVRASKKYDLAKPFTLPGWN